MKKNTLLIFCDMVRGNLLSFTNKNIKENNFERFLRSLDGVLYINSYTPAPDTGRGYAMLQTGLTCKKNGCDDVWKYPKFFLKEDLETLDQVLLENNINTKYLVTKRNDLAGIFDKKVKNKILVDFTTMTYEKGFDLLKKDLDTFDKNFFFVGFDDYHVATDDYGACMKSDIVGKEKLFNILDIFFKKLPKEIFDEIIIVSDHGNTHQYGFKDERVLDLLNDDRTKILLYRWIKGNNRFLLNNELRSILDVYPTILDSFSIKKIEKLDGISLNEKELENRMIVMESYSKFLHLAPLDLWGIRDKHHLYLTNLEFKKMYEIDNLKIKESEIDLKLEELYIKKLEEESVNYKLKSLEKESIIRYYEVLNYIYMYSDNSKRKIYNLERIKSIKMNRIPYYFSVILSKILNRIRKK